MELKILPFLLTLSSVFNILDAFPVPVSVPISVPENGLRVPRSIIGTTITNLLYWGTPASAEPKRSRYKPETMIAYERPPSSFYEEMEEFGPSNNYRQTNYKNSHNKGQVNSYPDDFVEFMSSQHQNDDVPYQIRVNQPIVAEPMKVKTKSMMNRFQSYMKALLFKPMRRRSSSASNVYNKIQHNDHFEDDYDGGKRILRLY